MPKKTDSGVKTFGCMGCGERYEAYPPDDYHQEASLQPCEKGDSIAMTIVCKACSHKNVIHWDTHHFVIASG